MRLICNGMKCRTAHIERLEFGFMGVRSDNNEHTASREPAEKIPFERMVEAIAKCLGLPTITSAHTHYRNPLSEPPCLIASGPCLIPPQFISRIGATSSQAISDLSPKSRLFYGP